MVAKYNIDGIYTNATSLKVSNFLFHTGTDNGGTDHLRPIEDDGSIVFEKNTSKNVINFFTYADAFAKLNEELSARMIQIGLAVFGKDKATAANRKKELKHKLDSMEAGLVRDEVVRLLRDPQCSAALSRWYQDSTCVFHAGVVEFIDALMEFLRDGGGDEEFTKIYKQLLLKDAAQAERFKAFNEYEKNGQQQQTQQQQQQQPTYDDIFGRFQKSSHLLEAPTAESAELTATKKALDAEKMAKAALDTELTILKVALENEKAARAALDTEIATLKADLETEKAAKLTIKADLISAQAALRSKETELTELQGFHDEALRDADEMKKTVDKLEKTVELNIRLMSSYENIIDKKRKAGEQGGSNSKVSRKG